jgi:hypothetical protein
MVDFGRIASVARLIIGNSGGSPLRYAARTSNPLVAVTPDTGTVPPLSNVDLAVAFDRRDAPLGRFSAAITFSTNAGDSTVAVVTDVADPGPSISNPSLQGCTVTATITGPVTVVRAWVNWGRQPVEMIPRRNDPAVWSAQIPAPSAVLHWSTSAEDANHVTRSSQDQGPVIVVACPPSPR